LKIITVWDPTRLYENRTPDPVRDAPRPESDRPTYQEPRPRALSVSETRTLKKRGQWADPEDRRARRLQRQRKGQWRRKRHG